MEKNSTLVRDSRYVSGGTSEVNSFAIEWWERAQIPIDDTDILYVVDLAFQRRIDLIAAQFLGSSRLWWIIAQMNGILDPYAEIEVGSVLRIPTQERAQTLIGGRIGGFESTREVPLTNITPIV